MGYAETMAAVREKYPQYADMPDQELGTALAAKFPEYKDLAAPPAPPAPTPQAGGVWNAAKNALSNRMSEAAAFPQKVADTLVPRDPSKPTIATPLDMIPKPSPSVALPLSLPGGGSVVTRLGALAAGKMMDDPKASVGENLTTGAKGIVGDPLRPWTMLTSPAALEAAVPAAQPLLNRILRSTEAGRRTIAAADNQRVGRTLEDVTGMPAPRTTGDYADAATGAVTRQGEIAASNDAAQAAHQAAVADARAKAAEATRGGRADRTAEWQRRQDEYRSGVERATGEADQSTTGLQNTVDAMTRVVNDRNRGQAAQGIHDVINRVSPQLAAALDAPGAVGLRNAGAGGARRVLGEGKEAVVQQLESGAPNGILVPALSDQPMPVRDALWALSEIGAGRGAQFAKNPLDRNILGAPSRQEYGRVAEQIRQGLDGETPGLGDLFQQGQQTYREGLAVTKTLLEPGKNWTATGDVNVPALQRDIIKPRNRRVIEDKLGPERYQDVANTVTNLPRELGPQRAPRIEPALPEPPAKPLQAAPVYPDIPAAPAQAEPSAADRVMTALFGPQNRIQQGAEATVNWPAVQRALQTPRVRAEIEAAVGPDGYDQILRSALRGATSGADRMAGEAPGLLSGRGSYGSWRAPVEFVRRLFPNASSRYVGNVGTVATIPPELQAILDVAGSRVGR